MTTEQPRPHSGLLQDLGCHPVASLLFNDLFTPPTRTRQNCLVLSAVVFTPPTRQDKTVLSRLCQRCEQAINCKLETGSRQDKTVLSGPRRRCEQAITLTTRSSVREHLT